MAKKKKNGKVETKVLIDEARLAELQAAAQAQAKPEPTITIKIQNNLPVIEVSNFHQPSVALNALSYAYNEYLWLQIAELAKHVQQLQQPAPSQIQHVRY